MIYLRVLARNILLIPILLLNACGQVSILAPKVNSALLDQVRYPLSGLSTQEVLAFDVYVSVNRIDVALAVAPEADKKQVSVYYVYSEDGGQKWSVAQEVGKNFPLPLTSRGNDIQIASVGDARVLLWQTAGELPNMGPIVSIYSTDAGKTWQQADNPARNAAGDQAHIDLLADQVGNIHAVWLEDPEENGYQSLRYARSKDGGQHWEVPRTLDTSTCSCCWNTFALSAKGEINLLYRNMQPRDMSLLQSSDDGLNWRASSTVGEFNWQFDGCPHIGGGLAVQNLADKTQLHSVVWTGVEKRQGLYYLSSEDNGKTWSLPHLLSSMALHGDIAVTKDGKLSAVWDERGPEGSVIKAMISPDAGKSWAQSWQISKLGSNATHPRIIVTAHGKLAMWTEKSVTGTTQWAMVGLE